MLPKEDCARLKLVRFSIVSQTRTNFGDRFCAAGPRVWNYMVAQKVSHYKESSLNRIENRQ